MSIFNDITLAGVSFGSEPAHDYAWQGFQFHGAPVRTHYALPRRNLNVIRMNPQPLPPGAEFGSDVIAASANKKSASGDPKQAGLLLGGLAVVLGLGYFVFRK